MVLGFVRVGPFGFTFITRLCSFWILSCHAGKPWPPPSVSSVPFSCKIFAQCCTQPPRCCFLLAFLQSQLCWHSLGVSKHLSGRLLLAFQVHLSAVPSSVRFYHLSSSHFGSFELHSLSSAQHNNRIGATYSIPCPVDWARENTELTLACLPSLRDGLHWLLFNTFTYLRYIFCPALNSCFQPDSWFSTSYSIMAGIKSFPLL